MAQYRVNGTFGGVNFNISDMAPSQQPSTLKTNLGKAFIEKPIPLRNAVDTIINITAILPGLSRTVGETVTTAVERDRAALLALDDGYKHLYNDGRHIDLNMVIRPGTLLFDDSASNEQGQSMIFTMTLVEWK